MIAGYEGSRVLLGPPGCGKSHFLATRVPRIVKRSGRTVTEEDSPLIICSLTVASAREIGSRVPELPHTVARTLHSHALRSTGCSAAVVDRKLVAEWNREHPSLALTLPPPRKGDAVPDDVVPARKGEQPGDDVAADYDRLRHQLVPLGRMPERVQRFAARWNRFKAEAGALDFTDMLEQAGAEPPLGAEIIVIDEAQDLSPLSWRVVSSWADGAGGLLAVGDAWQALYDPWAGASAAELLRRYREADERDILKQSFRVPAEVHRVAVRFARQLSYHESIEYLPRRVAGPGSAFVAGRVARCDATWTNPARAVDQAVELAEQGKRVLFLFSANYMTKPLCQAMRERVLLFSNPWRLHEPLWNPLRDGIGHAAAVLLDPARRWTIAGIHEWTKHLRAKGLLRRGARDQIDARKIEQRSVTREQQRAWFEEDAIEELGHAISQRRPERIIGWWRDRLSSKRRKAGEYAAAVLRVHGVEALDAAPLLHPSTIHASKGGEADHVFLFPDISAAADEAWLAGGKYRDPIVRAFYVGITRARECLYLCAPATRRFVELPR